MKKVRATVKVTRTSRINEVASAVAIERPARL
jgi:hypothetical protein